MYLIAIVTAFGMGQIRGNIAYPELNRKYPRLLEVNFAFASRLQQVNC